jgi:hypothetical protein
MKKTALLLLFVLSIQAQPFAQQKNGYTKTTLLADKDIAALSSEINGHIAKDHVTELARHHRVQASSGFSAAAEYIAARAKEYGLEQVQVERFAADGQKTYHTLKSTPGWEAQLGQLWEMEPRKSKIADYEEMRVALADYSQTADVTAQLVDVGAGTSAADYEGRDVKDKIVLAGGNVAVAHRLACDERGAAGLLSYQQNQVTAWSGDYVDNVRWGHLSPYNAANKFAFMISLRQAREFRDRLARGEQIQLRAVVKAEIKAGNYDVVSAIIPGSSGDEEIVFTCHLCHQKPGANDNASGAAAILEIARALNSLIRRGEIARPRRTIRFIWPPETNGTLVYFAEHPDIVKRIKAAVHMDMVGGNYAITKSVLHVTHTPASLPSAVNTVMDIFAEYAIAGSVKAASGAGFEDALIQPGGSKESLVADITPYEMGSDHDVYQEGSFRIPTIYLRDWPDVFIHTNNDRPENIEPTKIKRSSFIAASSGYFLARADGADAARLATEVFTRAMARVPREYERARQMEAGAEGAEEARNLISMTLEQDATALYSVAALAPEDKELAAKIDGFIEQLSGAWLLLTGTLAEQRKGNRVFFVLEPKQQPAEPKGKPSKPRNPKEAIKPSEHSRIPSRKVAGPMRIYYYDYVAERAGAEDRRVIERIERKPNGDIILYEILNLVDGKRTIQEIRNYIAASYGAISVEEVSEYLRLLAKIGVVTIE